MFHRLLSRRPKPAVRSDFTLCRFAGASQPGLSAEDRRREFRAVLTSTPRGRRILALILARCRVCAPSHVPGDTHETARREGMRAVGLWLLDQVEDSDVLPPETAAHEPGEST